MREAVVVLPPYGGRDQQIERSDVRTPRQLVALVQPLGVLVEHRIDNMDKRLVGRQEAVPPGQQVAFQPALQGMLAQPLHDPPVGCQLAAIGILGKYSPNQVFLVTS